MRRCSIEFQSWVQRIDKVLCTHSIKLSSLHCLRTSKRSSMGGGGVSALCCQRFWGAKRKKKRKKKKEEERKEKNWMMMKSSLVPLASLNSRYFEDYSILNYSNHVQSDNKDFSCALGSTVAICTCPPSKVCVPFSLSTKKLFSNGLFDESR